jgi:hypothetical protein
MRSRFLFAASRPWKGCTSAQIYVETILAKIIIIIYLNHLWADGISFNRNDSIASLVLERRRAFGGAVFTVSDLTEILITVLSHKFCFNLVCDTSEDFDKSQPQVAFVH